MQAMEKAANELPGEGFSYGSDKEIKECNERSLENQRYLINTGFHFGDWLIPSVVNEQGFTDGAASAFLTMNYVGSSLLAADADMYAEVSELVGNFENAQKYRAAKFPGAGVPRAHTLSSLQVSLICGITATRSET